MENEEGVTPENAGGEVDLSNYVSKEDLDASLSDVVGQIKEMLPKQPVTPEVPTSEVPWEKNPDWQPSNYGELASAMEAFFRSKGYSAVDAEQLAGQVQDKVVERQQKEQTENEKLMEDARKRVASEIDAVKKDDPDLDQTKVISFIQKWNEDHPATRITSFKDGYQIYKSMGTEEPTEQKPEKKVHLPGAPATVTGDEGKKEKSPRYKSVDDALAAALSQFEE